MAELVPITLEIADPFGRGAGEKIPTGTIAAIEALGERAQYRRWGAPVVKLETVLPEAAASNVLAYYQKHLARKADTPHNCLGFGEATQGRPADLPRLYVGDPPALQEGTYVEVQDPLKLIAGQSYGLVDSQARIPHAIVALPIDAHHLDVFGKGGQMRVGETLNTMQSFKAERLVQLTDSYVD